MEQVVRTFFFILKALPGPCGACSKKCNFRRRFAGPLLYSDMRVLSPLYPTVIRPLTEGRIAVMFAGDRDTMRRFFWGGSAREVASGSRKPSIVQIAMNSYYEPIL